MHPAFLHPMKGYPTESSVKLNSLSCFQFGCLLVRNINTAELWGEELILNYFLPVGG